MEPAADAAVPDGESEDGASSLKDLAQFALRSARQHLAFCVLIGLVIAFVGITIVSCIPPVFDATSKIFVQDGGAVTSSLASGRERYRPIEGTRGLEEFILARDNLLSIVREAKLYDRWPTTRPWPMRIKDRVMEALVGPPLRKDMERGFVEMLSKSITGAKDGESVRIHGQWRDRESAYEITRLVQRNFLAARAAHDLGPIQRAIPFLEAQLSEADQAIEAAVTRIHAAQSGAAAAPTGQKEGAPQPPVPAKDPQIAELAAISRQLAEARRNQRALVEPWRKRIADLKMELVEMRASYAPEHPRVLQQEARIEAASEVPEELAALREKEQELLNALQSRGVSRAAIQASDTAAPKVEPSLNSPELAPLQARLVAALRKSDDFAQRLESARIELATAEADFQHRYVVVEQPEMPNKPLKQKQPMLFAVVMILAVLVGGLSGSVRELRKGQLIEPWQVRALGLEIVGEAELKRLPSLRDRA